MEHNIIDNFLDRPVFDKMVDDIMPNGHTNRTINFPGAVEFPWVYKSLQIEEYGPEDSEFAKGVTDIELIDPADEQFFCFLFWHVAPISYCELIGGLIGKINPIAICRIQANLTLRQSERKRSRFHTDKPAKDNLSMTTSIFYMNTTNGPTILGDGTEIECIENRIVTFPYDTYHAGVSCTDSSYRIVINLNCFGTKLLS